MAEEFDKLVRDRIPRIVRENGEEPVTHEVSGAEYRDRLHEKLDEEVAEFHDEPSAAEMADVLAVLDALRESHGIEASEIERVRREKAEERGEFEDGVVLEAVRR
ncbi:nucleoside triphosphate pyrophosphohydrolase [Halosimplex salinum]|uniref:nucleoside triphosphate pyrophosphohydrolase n=1 Tax=Halosimplex salinum TaxID=1710538 RepID=UPI000F49ECDC|nr:nucleoside triphosphate pyrophosphohydrolase [Halosimplex salinum]